MLLKRHVCDLKCHDARESFYWPKLDGSKLEFFSSFYGCYNGPSVEKMVLFMFNGILCQIYHNTRSDTEFRDIQSVILNNVIYRTKMFYKIIDRIGRNL